MHLVQVSAVALVDSLQHSPEKVIRRHEKLEKARLRAKTQVDDLIMNGLVQRSMFILDAPESTSPDSRVTVSRNEYVLHPHSTVSRIQRAADCTNRGQCRSILQREH